MLSRRMSVNVGTIKFTAKTFRGFLLPAFSHQTVHLNSIGLVCPWSQHFAFMNTAHYRQELCSDSAFPRAQPLLALGCADGASAHC